MTPDARALSDYKTQRLPRGPIPEPLPSYLPASDIQRGYGYAEVHGIGDKCTVPVNINSKFGDKCTVTVNIMSP